MGPTQKCTASRPLLPAHTHTRVRVDTFNRAGGMIRFIGPASAPLGAVKLIASGVSPYILRGRTRCASSHQSARPTHRISPNDTAPLSGRRALSLLPNGPGRERSSEHTFYSWHDS